MSGNEAQIQGDPSNAGYNPFKDAEVYSTYTDAQAVKDGVLFDLGEIKPEWKRGLVNMVTTNLLFSKGYAKKVVRTLRTTKGDINMPNLLDLLNISAHILKPLIEADIAANGEPDRLYTAVKIEGPDGAKFTAYAAQNSSSFYTLMLPEDY